MNTNSVDKDMLEGIYSILLELKTQVAIAIEEVPKITKSGITKNINCFLLQENLPESNNEILSNVIQNHNEKISIRKSEVT